MNINTVNVTIKASKEIGGLWKTLEVGAEGTIEYGEDWHQAQARLYQELTGQLKALWASNGAKAQEPQANKSVQEPPKAQAKTSAKAKGNGATGDHDRLCPIHKTALRRYQKGEGAWYSHKLPDGSWCHGK